MKGFLLLIFISSIITNVVFSQCTCVSTDKYPLTTVTSTNTGLTQSISTLIWAGDSSLMTNFTTGKTYKFNSSIATDVLTLRQTYPNGLVCDANPISYTFSGAITDIYSLHTHTNTSCGLQSTSRTTYITCLDCVSSPGNDECSGATSITPTSGTSCTGVSRSPAGATQSMPGCVGVADDDIWFSFVATQTNHTIVLSSVTYDMITEVFSGSCGSLTQIVCSDPDNTVLTGLTIGETYYFRCYTKADGLRSTFSLCLLAPPPPPKSWVGGTGNWGVDANWSPAGVPTCSDSVAITSGAVSLAGAAGECKGIAVAGGSLNIDAGSLTIGTCGMSGGGNRYFILSSGSVNLNGGDLTINGGFVASGGALNINSGNMNVDPNGSSGVLAVSSFSLTSTGFTMTGGNLNLLDGPSSGNIFNFSNSSANNLAGGNVVIGGGSATLNPNINTWVGSSRIAFYNLVIQTGSSFVTSTYSFGILNDLTINSGELRGTTTLYVAGNITNNGTLTLSTCNLYLGSFASGTAGATSKAQIIGGSGNYRNSTTETADFYSITVNNTNASGATFDIVDPTLSSTLTMTAGKIFGSASGNFVLWAKSTVSYTAGWVVGNLKRTITASGATPFYVGTSGTYFPVTVNFTANPAGDLTAGFYSGAPGTSGLPLTESSGTNPYLSADSLWATGVWRITTSNIGSTTYSVSVTATGAPSNGNTANVRVVKRADNGSDWTNPGTHVNGSGVVFSRSGLSGFSEFGIVRGSLLPLPLELLSFNAVPVGRKNRITWTSTNEQNTAIHIIERASKDDSNKFIEIGKVTAAGTSTANLKYEFYDENPYLLGYYRLKTVDIDGSINYSEIVSCERTAERFAIKSIYPVPVENELTINYVSPESKAILVSIFDESGKEVVNFELQTVKGEGNESLNVKSLSSGIYFLRINEETFKFVKK